MNDPVPKLGTGETSATTSTRKIVAYLSSNSAVLIWDAEEALALRREYRLTGAPVGSLPRHPQQNVVLGLPVILMPEEVMLLLNKNALTLIDENTKNRETSIEQRQQFLFFRERFVQKQVKILKEDGEMRREAIGEMLLSQKRRRVQPRQQVGVGGTITTTTPHHTTATDTTTTTNTMNTMRVSGTTTTPTPRASTPTTITMNTTNTINTMDTTNTVTPSSISPSATTASSSASIVRLVDKRSFDTIDNDNDNDRNHTINVDDDNTNTTITNHTTNDDGDDDTTTANHTTNDDNTTTNNHNNHNTNTNENNADSNTNNNDVKNNNVTHTTSDAMMPTNTTDTTSKHDRETQRLETLRQASKVAILLGDLKANTNITNNTNKNTNITNNTNTNIDTNTNNLNTDANTKAINANPSNAYVTTDTDINTVMTTQELYDNTDTNVNTNVSTMTTQKLPSQLRLDSIKSPANYKYLRSCIFEDLHSRGYWMTSGVKFGGDFLVYPGDPFRYHSHFVAIIVPWKQNLTPLDIISFGRLGTVVKKAPLLCSMHPETHEITYFSFEWTGSS